MDKPNDTPPNPSRFRSPIGRLLLGAGLLVLLGLVAAASRAHHTPGGHAGIHTPPSGVADYVFTILVLLLLGLTLFTIWLFFTARDVLLPPRQHRQRSLRLLVLLALVTLATLAVSRVHPLPTRSLEPPPRSPQPGPRAQARRANGEERALQFQWLPVFLATAAGLTVLGIIGMRSLRRSQRNLVERVILEQEFEGLLEDTLSDLYAESDPRKAIIAAYARVERLFAMSGLPRAPYEAPLEYLERVLPELRASGRALQRLTALFQWAKFSAHDVDRPMRDEAIGALVEVRDELRANRLEHEPERVPA